MSVIDTVARRVLSRSSSSACSRIPTSIRRARATVASERFLAAGYAAQIRSTVLLKNAMT